MKKCFLKIIMLVVIACVLLLFWFVFHKPSDRLVLYKIERKLGFSSEIYEPLIENLSGAHEATPSDRFDFVMTLKDQGESRNLSFGILMRAATNNNSSVVVLATNEFQTGILNVFKRNRQEGLVSLLRKEDLSNLSFTNTGIVKLEGSFDWEIPDVMRGRCNFIYKRGGIDYLGIARDHSLGTYDSIHVFKGPYDCLDLDNWMVRRYYAVFSFNSGLCTCDRIQSIEAHVRKYRVPWSAGVSQQPGSMFIIEVDSCEALEHVVNDIPTQFDVRHLGTEKILKEDGNFHPRSQIKKFLKKYENPDPVPME